MRFRIAYLVASVGLVGGGVFACAGKSASLEPAVDAGSTEPAPTATIPSAAPAKPTAPEAGPKDAGHDAAADAAPPCDPSGDFTTRFGDAAIADGSSSAGLCGACARASCGAKVDACNKDCPCQNAARQGLECYVASGGDVTACAAKLSGLKLSSTSQSMLYDVFGCVQGSCKAECGTP